MEAQGCYTEPGNGKTTSAFLLPWKPHSVQKSAATWQESGPNGPANPTHRSFLTGTNGQSTPGRDEGGTLTTTEEVNFSFPIRFCKHLGTNENNPACCFWISAEHGGIKETLVPRPAIVAVRNSRNNSHTFWASAKLGTKWQVDLSLLGLAATTNNDKLQRPVTMHRQLV